MAKDLKKTALHKQVGQFLKGQRVRVGLTQASVANRLGYSSPQFISNIERGLCSPPLKNLSHLVDLYRINPEDLLKIIVQEHENLIRKALNL